MKYRHQHIWQTVLCAATVSQLLLLASCAREDLNWLIGEPITVVASTETPVTRSGDDIQTSNFKEGALLNAYYNISGGDTIGKNPTTLTASAPSGGKNVLTPDVQPYYPQSGTVDIMALYPQAVANKDITSFEVKKDQQKESDYMLSDLMWAGLTGQGKTTGDVNLQFKHLMAKMSVKVTAKEGVLVKRVSLQNIVRKVGITNLSSASYTLADVDTEHGTKESILLASTTDETVNNMLSGSALFPEQTIGGNFIKVETNYGDVYYSVVNKTFRSGHAYSADLVVKRQDIGYVTAITDWESNDGSIAVPPGSSAGLKIKAIAPQPYNGHAQEPELSITYTPNDALKNEIGASDEYNKTDEEGAYILYPCTKNEDGTYNEDGDFKAEYFNNTNQGTAMVIITGMKNPNRYATNADMEALANVISGINSMTSFLITAATGNLTYQSNVHSVEYDYNTIVDFPLDAHDGDGTITFESSHPEVADVTNSGVVTIRSAGSTRVTATMAADGNYTAASAYYDLTVTPRSLSSHASGETPDVTATIAGTSFPYIGVAYRPAVVVKDKGRTLQEGRHYALTYSNNINKGTATVTIKGMGNYSDADADAITRTFTISEVTPNIQMITTAVKMAQGQKFTRRATTNHGTVTYKSSDETIATVDANGVVTAVVPNPITYNKAARTVTITASVAADSKGWAAKSESYQVTVVESDWRYSYTGNVQTWTCPIDGVWELEAMGAQGATAGSYAGGRGADVAGQVFVKAGQVIYIYVGQTGASSGSDYTWNGGGYGSSTAGGGGGTDFALKKATWNNDEHLNSRILVAGGGGGALNASGPFIGGGGSGGGEGTDENGNKEYVGETGKGGSHPGLGGTLSAGGAVTAGGTGGFAGSFGKGGHFNGTGAVGAGGGGWFGGASGSTGTRQGAGGGGSSFIYNADNLKAAKDGGFTYTLQLPTATTGTDNLAANNFFVKTQTEADADPKKVYLEIIPTTLVTGGSPDLNGQARITYISEE